jgi:hypothetical protein
LWKIVAKADSPQSTQRTQRKTERKTVHHRGHGEHREIRVGSVSDRNKTEERIHRRARKGLREKQRERQFTTEGTESTEGRRESDFFERPSVSVSVL